MEAAILVLLPAVALRWVLPVSRTLAFGFPDLTTALFFVPLLLGVIGFPGYILAVASKLKLSTIDRSRFWIIASLLAELNAAIATVVLWVISSNPILTTLDPVDWIEWLAAPLTLATVCIWLRQTDSGRSRVFEAVTRTTDHR